MPEDADTVEERSAGGLVVRSAGGGSDGPWAGEILLISLSSGRRWQLPKGHIEEGESEEEAAVREVREETGVTGRVTGPLPEIEYWFVQAGQQVHKRVRYFLLDYVSGSQLDYDPSEVSGAEWWPWEEGIARLSFDNEREVARTGQKEWARRAGRTDEGTG